VSGQKKTIHLKTGQHGERLAGLYFRLIGYRIIRRNFRCRLGEIDIIAGKGNLLVFAEVRTRYSGSLQHPLQTVDPVKVSRTVRAAQVYLQGLQRPLPHCRFDIVAITVEDRIPFRRLLHVKDAFNVTSDEYEEGHRRGIAKKRRRFGKSGKW